MSKYFRGGKPPHIYGFGAKSTPERASTDFCSQRSSRVLLPGALCREQLWLAVNMESNTYRNFLSIGFHIGRGILTMESSVNIPRPIWNSAHIFIRDLPSRCSHLNRSQNVTCLTNINAFESRCDFKKCKS